MGEGVRDVRCLRRATSRTYWQAPGKSQRERNRDERQGNPAPADAQKRERAQLAARRGRRARGIRHATLRRIALRTGSSMVAMTP